MEQVAESAGLRASLRERGLRRVEQVRWEKTARLTFEAYRKAVLNPTEQGPLASADVARGDPTLVAARCSGARDGSREEAVARRADPGGPQHMEGPSTRRSSGESAARAPQIPSPFDSQTGLTMTGWPRRSNLDPTRG